MKNYLIEELKRFPQWVCHPSNKRPYVALIDKLIPAKPNKPKDPDNVKPYKVAIEAVAKNKAFTGVGYVMDASQGYICIDLDHCVNRETGEMKEPAATIVTMIREAGGTYIEYSPSGEGLHIWGRGCLPKGHENGLRSKQIELYQGGHYMTVTGKPLDNATIKDIQSVVDTIIEKYDLLKEKTATAAIPSTSEKIITNEKYPTTPAAFSDDDLIKVGRRMKDKDGVYKFHLLFDIGDISSYGNDDNRADAALLTETAFLTNGNAEQMGRIFLRSKLAETLSRKQHHEADYLRRSISKALACWEAGGRKHYDPSYFRQGQEITLISPPDPSDDTQPGRPEGSTAGQIKILLSKDALMESNEAELMMKQYEKCIRFCTTFNCWLHYTGKKWEPFTPAEMLQYAKKTIDSIKAAILVEMGNVTGGDSTRMKNLTVLLNHVITQYNKKPLAAIVDVAKGINAWNAAKADTNRYYLNCDNGILDLKTGKLTPHEPGQMLMKNTGVAYTGKYHSSLWCDTVAAIFPDPATREYVQLVFGATLAGIIKDEKFFFFTGPGGNGKGTFLQGVFGAFGGYATKARPGILLNGKYKDDDAGDKPNPTIMGLRGIRFTWFNELSAKAHLNAAELKRISGDKDLTGRPMYGTGIDHFPRMCNFFLDTNYMPGIDDVSDKGILRRLVNIPFNADFSQDKRNADLKSIFDQKEEKEDILFWCTEGAKKYISIAESNGGKSVLDNLPPQIKQANNDYYEKVDIIGEFIHDYFICNREATTPAKLIHEDYLQVCHNRYISPLGRNTFYEIIERRFGLVPFQKNKTKWYRGIGRNNVPITT